MGNTKIVESPLREKTFLVNHAGVNRNTALMLASYFGRLPIVELLLAQKGIGVNRVNNNGETAFDLARGGADEVLTDVVRQATKFESTNDETVSLCIELVQVP